jgi:hypothetical protein
VGERATPGNTNDDGEGESNDAISVDVRDKTVHVAKCANVGC